MRQKFLQGVRELEVEFNENLGILGRAQLERCRLFLKEQYSNFNVELHLEITDGKIVKGNDIAQILHKQLLSRDSRRVLPSYLQVKNKALETRILKLLDQSIYEHIQGKLQQLFREEKKRIKEVVMKPSSVFNITTQPVSENVSRLCTEGSKFVGACFKGKKEVLRKLSEVYIKGVQLLIGRMENEWISTSTIKSSYKKVKEIVTKETLKIWNEIENKFNKEFSRIESTREFKICGGNKPNQELKRMELQSVPGIYVDIVDKG